MNNVPYRVLAEPLERARLWVPWPIDGATAGDVEYLAPPGFTTDRMPITDPGDDTDTQRHPTPTDPDDDDIEDAGDGEEVELSASDRYRDGCAICHSDSCAC